jgi:CTP:molybdopterin cytidylyltransferase MocA
MRTTGIVLAAGAGTRFGGPKGLARSRDDVPWVQSAVGMLRASGARDVVVVVGAEADAVAALVPAGAVVVHAADWAEGMAASLRAGLAAAADLRPDAVVVTLADTPDAPPSAVRRVVGALGPEPANGLAQAVYRGRPGHPVAIGSAHLAAVAAALVGDRGARSYLVAHGAAEVECGDLWSGADVDEPVRALPDRS